jgi:phosphate transport system protein
VPEREHTSKHYESQLRWLKDKLLTMGCLAEDMIVTSIQALRNSSPSLAEEVIQRDDELDRLELEIDARCLEILAREQPVAGDLRFITTALKIVKDLEQIGNLGVYIAERTAELLREPELKSVIDMEPLANATQRNLRDSLDSFVHSDVTLAEKVIQNDRVVDDLHAQILQELLSHMTKDPTIVFRALKLVLISKSLERIGDHSTNIAEMVIFWVKGCDVRH